PINALRNSPRRDHSILRPPAPTLRQNGTLVPDANPDRSREEPPMLTLPGTLRTVRALRLAIPLSLIAPAFAQSKTPLVIETAPLLPAQQQPLFHLPPGFEIQLVASDPDIGQPMNMNFDAAGRLWVTSSVEYPYPVAGEGV